MVRVCEKDFPNKKKPEKSGFFMDGILKDNLDSLLKNITKDWDFVIVISGSGQVRVGKSVLALQIGYYWTYMLKELHKVKIPFTIKNNIIFHGEKLIQQGNYLGEKYPYSVLIFDEAGADLVSTKVLRASTQAVKDYLRECGQYNMLTILVLPDYFDLPKGIALSRSDMLIDVYSIADNKGIFQRGFFDFYSRKNKKQLYLKGKKELNYTAHKRNFYGRYYNFYPVDEQEYRKAKMEALKTREVHAQDNKYIYQRNVCFDILKDMGLSTRQTSAKLREKGVALSYKSIAGSLLRVTRPNYTKIPCEVEDDGEGEGG